jgi:hypothetical protein
MDDERNVCIIHHISDTKMAHPERGSLSYIAGTIKIFQFGETGDFKTMREDKK